MLVSAFMKRMLVVACIFLGVSTAIASEFDVAGRFGACLFDPVARLDHSNRNGNVDGARLVAVDVTLPLQVVGLSPKLSLEYQWTGFASEFPLTMKATVLSGALSRTMPLGYADVVVSGGLSYVVDKYNVDLVGRAPFTLTSRGAGMTIGCELRFKFFDAADAVVGYKYLRRGGVILESGGEQLDGEWLSEPYRIEGRNAAHCISFGVGFRVAGV